MNIGNPLNEPVAFGAAIRMVLVAAMSFGLTLTDAQLVASMAAVEAVLGLFTRQSVTPTRLVKERQDEGRDAAPGDQL
jgi:hypothetical protein